MLSHLIVGWATASAAVAVAGYALVRWARSRDAIHRQILLILLTDVGVAAVDIGYYLTGEAPPLAVAVTGAVYLFQPVLTLQLANSLRPVSRRVLWATGAGAALTLVALATLARPLPKVVALGYVLVFAATEIAAARSFGAAARARVGSARLRLRFAAAGAWARTAALALAVGGNIAGWTAPEAGTIAPAAPPGVAVEALFRGLLLFFLAASYVAFLPPRWLRDVWNARALQEVSQAVTEAPPAESAPQIWGRYVHTVRRLAGTAAVEVLLPRPDGTLYRPTDDMLPAGIPAADLAPLVGARQPALVGGRRPPPGRLAAYYAATWGRVRVTGIQLDGPRLRGGALLAVTAGHSLFTADDLRLLAGVARPVAVLAERGALLARQHTLADELAGSVADLTAASQAKSAFLAAMSHELRTPLHAIIGFSDLARDDLRGHPAAEWVGHIQRSGAHLLALINDLLDLSKVESGQIDLRCCPVRLDTAVEQLLASLHPMIADKRLRVSLELAPVTASVDPMRFRQIAENLLSNAIKYTPADGEVRVRLAVRGHDVTVVVADSGVGIPAEDQHLIFEEYRQVGPAQVGSTGLGLALSRRLARAHGGDLIVESLPGQGAAFTLSLPGARLDAPSPVPPAPATPTEGSPSPPRD